MPPSVDTTKFPATMRAAQWTSLAGGIEKNLKLNTSAPLPKNAASLPDGHTLVRVSHATLNPVDYKFAEAVGPYLFKKPATPGADYAGHVVASRLPHLHPGDAVFGSTALPAFGCLGEYVVAGAAGCAPVPAGVAPADAACLGIAGLTAYQSIVPHVRPGARVLINGGSGGTGTFGIQFAKAAGCHVTATCSGANVALCRELGADEVVDYRSEDVVAALRRAGHRFDHIVDNVLADLNLYWNCHLFSKPEAQFLTIAGAPSLGSFVALFKAFCWPAWLGGGQRKFVFFTCTANAEQYTEVARLMQEGKVKAVIEKEYALEDAGGAFARMKSGRTRGKLVVKVAGE